MQNPAEVTAPPAHIYCARSQACGGRLLLNFNSIKQFVSGERNRHGCRASEIQSRRRASGTRLPRPRGPVEKAIRFIDEAGAAGARLIAFPETWIPGYPWWIWLGSPAWAIMRGFVSRYFDNSLAYDSPQAERLRAAAKRNNIFVVLGLCERAGGSLYIAQWIIGPDGETVAKRRKLKPTHAERTVFGEGDGCDLAVHDLEVGRLGALCCWEHLQPLSKYAMYAQNEQIHVAAWPSFSLYDPFAHALGAEVNNAASQIYAVEGSCFVIAPCATVSQAMIDELCDTPEKHQFLHAGGGFAVIYGPDGAPLAQARRPTKKACSTPTSISA